MAKFLAFEHRVLSELKSLSWHSPRLLLAVSGGADSMALIELFYRLQPLLKVQVRVANVHHGGSSPYRTRARKFVAAQCKARGLKFLALGPPNQQSTEPSTKSFSEDRQSESSLRQYRYQVLEEALLPGELLVLGHHRDDLLETRLIRLIRGVGPQGLTSMRTLRGHRLRPFLPFGRSEILSYLSQRRVDFLEDPSNADTRYFRNWLRNQWLPELEKVRPGSLSAFAESLENLSHLRQTWPKGLWLNEHTLNRPLWLTLTVERQMSCLARLLYSLGVQNFTKNHLKEILRYLDKEQIEHRFRVAGCNWEVNAKHITLVKGV